MRSLLSLGLAAALAVTLVQATPSVAAGALISQGRPVTASSSESAAFPGSAAVDGNLGTRWSSAFSDPQSLEVDLGSTFTVDQVTLNWEAAFARAFSIQVSTNATTWSTVYTTTTGAGGTQVLPVSGSARYVRLNLTTRATQYGYSLWEFQVFGTTGGGGDPSPTETLLSYNKSATASTYQDDGACPGCTPAKATDFDPATRWATSATNGWVDPGWITVDLGATATITKVVLQWDPAYATAYQIQVSPNNSTWTNIYQTTQGRGFKETLTVSGTGRYVRMYGTARSNGYGYSLWEFQVYGTGGSPTTPPSTPAPNFTRLAWSDEFNGAANSTPDSSKWTPEVGPGVNNELQYYTNNNNARMDGGGNLVIQARREATPGSACPPDPVSGGSTTCQYTSGRLNTAGKFEFTYGRVEARIKVSTGTGLWPAFWLLGGNFFQGRPWPACGEIDILEHVGKEPNNVYSTLHAPAYFGGGGYGSPLALSTPAGSQFHTYAVEWDSTQMRFFVDSNNFFTASRATIEATRGPWVFDHPFFIILNNAVGGDWPGPPNAGTQFPQNMTLDYVRVYR
jgi:beta-glucanase (GH16 family)